MIAELGYVALAIDMYGGGRVAGPGGDDAMTLMGALREDNDKLRQHVRAGYDALVARPNVDPKRIGAMGYCFGGLCVLELARMGTPLAGVVSFHGILSTKNPDEAKNITGKILVCTGAEDPLVPPEQVAAFEAEMTKANVDWQVITYGGTKHAFTNPEAGGRMPALAYNANADARSWDSMRTHWFEVFGKP
jgi:dienelactone hydrolase